MNVAFVASRVGGFDGQWTSRARGVLRFAAAALPLAPALLAAAPASAAGKPAADPPIVELKVNLDTIIQTNFLGISGTYDGFNHMPEPLSHGYNDEDRAREYDRLRRMGIRIVRAHKFRASWIHEGRGLAGKLNWQSDRMKAFCAWVKEMKDLGIDIGIPVGWRFPGDTYNGLRGAEPTDKYLGSYGKFYAEFIHQLVVVRGLTNVKYGFFFLEPQLNGARGKYMPGENSWTWFVKTVKALDAALKERGLRDRIKLVGPNNTSGAAYIREAGRDLADVLDIFSGHTYNLNGYGQWHALFSRMERDVAKTGKPVWVDEGGLQKEAYRETARYGTYTSEMFVASINAGNQAFFVWQVFDQHYDGHFGTGGDSMYHGVHRWGTCYWPHDTVPDPTSCRPWFYSFSMISRLLTGGPGTKVFATSGGRDVHVCAVRRPGGDHSFLVVNSVHAPRRIALRLSAPLNATVHRYLYDPECIAPTPAAKLIRHTRTFDNVAGQMEDELPARAVAVYSTIDLGAAERPAPPTDVKATPLSATRIKLTWQCRPTENVSVRIERRAADNVFGVVARVPAAESEWLDRVAFAGTEHTYRLAACRNDGAAAAAADVTVRTPAAPPLMARWPFNNDGGRDSSGNGGPAKPINGARFATDAREGSHALELNGKGASADCGPVNVGATFSFAAWAKIPPGATDIQTLVANSADGYETNGFRFGVNTWRKADGRIALETGNGKDGSSAATDPGAFTFDQWRHVVLTVDRTAGRAEIYVDGKKLTRNTAIRTDFAYAGRVTLGSMHGKYPMKGLLDDVRLYSYILTDKEIAALAKPPAGDK